MDASKHVSTHAEDAAYKLLEEKGCVVIKGRSGSGKTHMGYTLLQRASKEFSRKPVKISSPNEWNYLSLSGDDSNSISKAAADQYIVMIDDIFGSFNLIQHNLDQWRQKFDLVWPHVESGQIRLVITTRPEIITQREASLCKYEIFKSSRRIILDEEEHCLTEKEKMEFVTNLCGNCIAYEKRTSIARTDTALGFPQCCKYFASHKHVQEKGLDFFIKPFEFIKQEIDSVKEEQPDSYCVLLVVLAYDGSLPEELVKTISPKEEFTNRCKQMMKVSGLKQEPNMKEILKSLCGVYLVNDWMCYEFSHRSIHDVLFVDLCESYPDVGIDMSTPYMLVEHIRTTGLKCDTPNVVNLPKEYFPKLANKLTEYLSKEDSQYYVLAHPSLNDGKIVELLKGCDIRRISLQRGENVFQFGRMFDDSSYSMYQIYGFHWYFEGFADLTYCYFLSHTIMKGIEILAKYIIRHFSTATDTATQSMFDEALLCAVYMGQNSVVDILLSKGAQPSQNCLDILSGSPKMNIGNFSKLVGKVKPKQDCLKLPIVCAAQCGNVTFLNYTIEMFPENMKDMYSEAIERLMIKLNESAMSEDISSTLSKAVEVMSLLHKAGGIVDLDEIVTLAFHKYTPDALIGLIHRLFQIPSSCHNDMQSSLFHNKSYHQLLKSLTDKVAPVQIKDKTVKILLRKAANYQCKQCINILLSDDVEVTDRDGNTALHCMIKSCENHDHEVLELLMDKTNHRHIKNKRGELPLHIAVIRHCRECISHLLREADVSRDHAGNPVHCTCDEAASYHRDESHEHVRQESPFGKGSDVTMKINKEQTTRIQCKNCWERPIFHINDQDETGNTAIHYLTHWTSYSDKQKECIDHETCQLFLKMGADVGIKNNEGQTVLHIAAKANCKKCVEALLPKSDVNCQDVVGNTPLHYLTRCTLYNDTMKGCLAHEICQLVLKKGADVGVKNKEGQTVLHMAAKANCKKCVETLLPKSDVNAQDVVGNTPLHYLIHDEIDFDQYYYEFGDSYDTERKECLAHEIYPHFLEMGADVDIKNKKGQTVLHMAAKANCEKCVEILVLKCDVNCQDMVGNTALHYLTRNVSYIDIMKGYLTRETCQLFLKNGTDVGIKNKKGQTVLHMAAEANCKQCVEILVLKCDVNAQDVKGNTPLHSLKHIEMDCDQYNAYGKKECLACETCQLFLEKGANVGIQNNEGQTVVHMAAKANCEKCVEMMLPKSDVNAQDVVGNTPLHYLTHNESYNDLWNRCLHHETYQLFLEMGADVDIKNKNGQTVLHIAAKANCKKCVEMLQPKSDV